MDTSGSVEKIQTSGWLDACYILKLYTVFITSKESYLGGQKILFDPFSLMKFC